jgi:hypothetical protein
MTCALLFVLGPSLRQTQPVLDTAVIPVFREADPQIRNVKTYFKRPIDEGHTLLIVAGTRRSFPSTSKEYYAWGTGDLIGVFLMETGNPDRVWKLAILADSTYDTALKVERFDYSSIVFSRSEANYGVRGNFIKLFFDVRSKRLLRRRDYPPTTGATQVVRSDDQLCATMRTGETTALLACVQDGSLIRSQTVTSDAPDVETTPRRGRLPRLPQSTYDEFAQARPDRVRNGYTRSETRIEETVGAWQAIGNRIWFGKAFYDGEGVTGVGAVGYFDTATDRFTLVSASELAPWSTSALLVEGDTAWLGLARQPEGARYSNGLLRLNVSNGRSHRYPVPDVILSITRWNYALYLGTTHGLYVLRDGNLVRFRVEPGLDGKFLIVAEHVPQ